MSWQEVIDFPNYEIWTEYPYQIRKKSNQRIVKERVDNKRGGYLICCLNGKSFYKHRIIAKQFIPNPNKYEFVDHISRVRTDNRIENLRWLSQRMNNNNRTDQEFVDEISDDAILVEKYNNHEFEDLYFYDDVFYFYNGINYTIKPKHMTKQGYYTVKLWDKNGKECRIYYSKLKREYGLI